MLGAPAKDNGQAPAQAIQQTLTEINRQPPAEANKSQIHTKSTDNSKCLKDKPRPKEMNKHWSKVPDKPRLKRMDRSRLERFDKP